MKDHKNTILAVVLSMLVLLGWEYFVGYPQMEKQRQELALKQQQQQSQAPTPGNLPTADKPTAQGTVQPQLPGQGAAPTVSQQMTREDVLKASPRIKIETPRISGSIALKGAAMDDIELTQYHETIDPKSPPIVLLSPQGSPHPFFAEFGWAGGAGATVKTPDGNTVWAPQGNTTLGVGRPVTLTWDNGEGL
jgi:YidC/Oxa1 family membrane protein insertase